ncbi:MAG: hypothetical protein GXO87_12585 [Chlorobi bacterium]|nr:hypothetical protein [Chlorobiota bacterium]
MLNKILKFNRIFFPILLSGIFLFSCGEPVPTEIIPAATTDEEYDVEILSPNPNEYVYSTGYDSTGLVEPLPRFDSYILLSGVKNDFDGNIRRKGYGGAVFFDKNAPVYDPLGKLIGYKSRALGRVTFDGDTARIVPRLIRFLAGGIIRDTIGGVRHISIFDRRNAVHPFFPYDADVAFKLKVFGGGAFETVIHTPPEIDGKLKITGSRANHDLKVELLWNGTGRGKAEIIFGGILNSNGELFPLLKFTIADNGRIRIPNSALAKIPFDRFDKMTITLIRRIEKIVDNNTLNKNFIAAQSIHNIVFDVP